jgi:hypothetical protein
MNGQHHAPAALYPQERIPVIHLIGDCVGLGAALAQRLEEIVFASARDPTLVV